MKFTNKFSSFIVSILAVFFMMNLSYASSGKISFEGMINRDACAVGDFNILDQIHHSSQKIKKIPFHLTFSHCDMNPDAIKVNFYDISLGDRSNITKDIIFNLIENTKKIIEVDGDRYYLPMKLKGYYLQDNNVKSHTKLIVLGYH